MNTKPTYEELITSLDCDGLPTLPESLMYLSMEEEGAIRDAYTRQAMRFHPDDLRRYRQAYGEYMRVEAADSGWNRGASETLVDRYMQSMIILREECGIQPQHINTMAIE